MLNQATLRLFNSIQINKESKTKEDTLKHTIKNGYIISPDISVNNNLLKTINSIVGISGEKANASFHKSWEIIQESSIEKLVFQQILHYFTTYGFEQLGIYDKDLVYIPNEILELPKIKDQIPLIIIHSITSEKLLNKIIDLGNGIALSKEVLNDIMIIIKHNKYSKSFVSKIKNRELKALLFDHYGIVPSEPVEFLRYIISKLTDESLLIKNDYLINKIKESNGKFLDELMKQAPENLASIFFRFKPLFLAMKSISKNRTFFNQLRKKADKLHIPLKEDYLNSITQQIKNHTFNFDILQKELESASIFRKIRLAYALKFREHAGNSIIYKVRNGSGWATDFKWDNSLISETKEILKIVLNSISDSIKSKVNNKNVYIPKYIHYTLPATEKQFTGFLPTGTYIDIPNDMVVGIHWDNVDGHRIDLDLSVIGISGKTGWDADYRSENNNVLFSGDITDAPKPNGATELFYLKQAKQEIKIMMVNYYNYNKDIPVPTKIITGYDKIDNFGGNYMIDINKIIASANIEINKQQTILGLIAPMKDKLRFYFSKVSTGNDITSYTDQATQSREFLENSLINSIELNDILKDAGANIITEKTKDEFIDLSPEVLTKTTIIDLLNS